MRVSARANPLPCASPKAPTHSSVPVAGANSSPPSPIEVEPRHGQDQRPLGAHRPAWAGASEGGRADDVGEPQQQAALAHRHPGVGQQRRQPGATRVELHALQPEVGGHLRASGCRSRTRTRRRGQRLAGPVRPAGAGHRQPERQGGERQHQPEAQRRPPADPEGGGERHGRRRARGGADVQRGRVEAHDGAGARGTPASRRRAAARWQAIAAPASRLPANSRATGVSSRSAMPAASSTRDSATAVSRPIRRASRGRRRRERPEAEHRQRGEQAGQRRRRDRSPPGGRPAPGRLRRPPAAG